ncbi:MAG TPA: metalloregulator ArsR/SmtB family transcription factor [Caulobacteraceae bacterium]|jgi:DNA-binding transcriptional ArsR family regulator|nr:metalloregulator ArsR/SmtB family transcription factor [Caulobacteraceae bacterium]
MSLAATADAAPLFAALGEPVRLRLIDRLARDGPLASVELRADVPVTRQAIAKHLAVLLEAGLVESERVGRDRRWRVRPDRLSEAGALLDALSRRWDDRLARLKALVEADPA